MKLFIASDHAGFELKGVLVEHLRAGGHDVEDLGPATLQPEDDYPNTIAPLAQKVSENKGAMGIAIGGSGQGEAIVCNRVSGVRAVVYYGCTTDILRLSREHNDANVLSLGARFLSTHEAKEAVSLWLSTPFSNDERHIRRIAELS
jgi:ribose 5-phosphate isomerase B